MTGNNGFHRPTIDDVAAVARVSTATVSRVVNGKGQVSERTAQRVHSAIEELGYIPHGAARDLARSETRILGIAVPGTITPYYASLFRGIDRRSSEDEYSLLVYVNHVHGDAGYQQSLVLGGHNTDGMIIFTNSVTDNVIQKLHRRRFPMVLLHREPPSGTEMPCITVNNETGVRQLMTHLIEVHGCRRIAHIQGIGNNRDTAERDACYRAVLREHGLPIDESIIAPGDFMTDLSEQVVTRWLEQGKQFDAIFAADDNAAVGALTALRSAGMRVPEDVAVVGFNDDPMAAHLTPKLTTVRADTEEVGYQAAQQLLALIQEKPVEMLIRLPTEIVVRESCGC